MKLIALAPNLMVKNVEETIGFYQKLGFELINVIKDEAGLGLWAMVQTGNVRLMFQQKDSLTSEIAAMGGIPIGATINLYITVEGIQEFLQKISSTATVVKEMSKTLYGVNEFTIQDLNGYFLTFAENSGPE